jgi:YggT family protein
MLAAGLGRLYLWKYGNFTARMAVTLKSAGTSVEGRPDMDVILFSLIRIINVALNLYLWCIIISAVLSWLVAFNVVNTSNKFVYMVGDFLYRITEPALRPIRQFMPNLGGIDISPVLLILIIYFIQSLLVGFAARL